MPAKKFTDDQRQQAISLTLEHLAAGESMNASLKAASDVMGCSPASIRYWAAHVAPPVLLTYANSIEARQAMTAEAHRAHRTYALEDLRQQAFDLNEIAVAGIDRIRETVQTADGGIDKALVSGEILTDVGRLAVIVQRVARIDADIDRRGIHVPAGGAAPEEAPPADPRAQVDELEAGWRLMQGGKA